MFSKWLSILEGNSILIKDSLIHLNSEQQITHFDIHTENPKHHFTLVYLPNGVPLLPIPWMSTNFDMSHEYNLGKLWCDPSPTVNEYDRTTTSHHWALMKLLLLSQTFRLILQGNKKCEGNCTFRCDVGVCVNHAAIWQHKPVTSASLICESEWLEITITEYFSGERKFTQYVNASGVGCSSEVVSNYTDSQSRCIFLK